MADKMSTMLIRESTDFDDSTEEDFELAQENIPDITEHGRKIFKSNEIIDKRLVKIYKFKRWKEDYKRHKGQTQAFDELNEFLNTKIYQGPNLRKSPQNSKRSILDISNIEIS